MRLLFDHNLSHKLCRRLADIFPDSTQTRLVGLGSASDQAIWQFAVAGGLAVATLDKDFADMSLLRGAPPKVIWLRCGNSTVAEVERLLRANLEDIRRFEASASVSLLEIWP
jgi:predicted nuclease of predicted toxin-antitoxin system